jgi:hypothetical protein
MLAEYPTNIQAAELCYCKHHKAAAMQLQVQPLSDMQCTEAGRILPTRYYKNNKLVCYDDFEAHARRCAVLDSWRHL